MTEALQIRRACLADAGLITSANRAMAQETEGKDLAPNRITPGVQAALEDAAKAAYYIATLDGQPVGQAMVTREWSDWRNGWLWWFQSVYVLPECRRRGVFRALYEYVRQEAQANGEVRGLRLYVARSNRAAIATYQALGMEDAGYQLMEEEF